MCSSDLHAYKYFEEDRVPEPFPNGTGYSSFGKGIFSVNKELHNIDQRYHDIDGETAWGSPKNILAPILHHATGPNKKLMMNWHSSPLLGRMIDNMMDCAEDKVQAGVSIEACSAITEIMPNRTSWVQGAETGPGSLMMQPVYPAAEPQKVRQKISAGKDELTVVSGVSHCWLLTVSSVYRWLVSSSHLWCGERL